MCRQKSPRSALAFSLVLCTVATLFAVAEQKLLGQGRHTTFALDAGITPRLRRNSGTTQYFIDQFGPSVQPFGKTVEVVSGENVLVRGWAVDTSASNLAGGVEIVIDDSAYSLPYFLTRTDVATTLGKEAYTDCGFLGIVSPQLLLKGVHTVSLRIVSANHDSYYQSPTFRLVVRPDGVS